MNLNFSVLKFFVLLLLGVVLVQSCSKKDDPVIDGGGTVITNRDINTWVLDSMLEYYYWNNEIPGNSSSKLDNDPEVFFESLLSNSDRFSWIQNVTDLKNELSGIVKTSGLGFSFFRIGESNAGIAVRYVLKDSPADKAGIKRGDVFTRLNGAMLTISNDGYVQNYDALLGNVAFTLATAVISNESISETGGTITLTPVENFIEKAIHMSKVFTTSNGKKVGYIFYNRYLSSQIDELLQVIGSFKAQGVDELIVDERYNGGGGVDAAAVLSGVIHQNFIGSSIFIKYEFNSNFENAELTYRNVLRSNSMVTNVNNNNLGLSRVFILATSSSASASELLINNLKPFLGASNVIHIGATTYGKDEASTTIMNSDERFADSYAIQPILLKYKNALGEGDFHNGLVPTYAVSETLPFSPMGDETDPLIARALSIIDPSDVSAQANNKISSIPTSTSKRIPAMDNQPTRDKIRPLDVTETLREIQPVK